MQNPQIFFATHTQKFPNENVEKQKRKICYAPNTVLIQFYMKDLKGIEGLSYRSTIDCIP